MHQTGKEALRIAHALREKFRAKGELFTQPAFRRALARRLKHLRKEAYDGFVDHIAGKVDRDAIDKPGRPQGLFDMEGEYRLGDNGRIAKRYAMIQHAIMALELDDKNVKACVTANRKKHDELEALRPYWTTGRTKAQAMAAYLTEHPTAEGEAG